MNLFATTRSTVGHPRPSAAMFRHTLALGALTLGLTPLAFAQAGSAATPALGPNVIVFDPSMPTSQIQATVDAISAQQVSNQFGTQRYALLFKPGTYGTAAQPLARGWMAPRMVTRPMS